MINVKKQIEEERKGRIINLLSIILPFECFRD